MEDKEKEERESLLIRGGKGTLKGGLWGLEKYGQGVDWANDQVNLRTLQRSVNPWLQIPGASEAVEKYEPEWLTNIMDYSYKDLRDDVSSGVGQLTENLTGSETAGNVAEFGSQVLLPDITDVKTGGIPVGAIPRVAKKLRKVDFKTADRVIQEAFSRANSIFNKGNLNWRLAGANNAPVDDLNKGNVFFSKANEGLGNAGKISRNVSSEYTNIVSSGMKLMKMEDGVFDIYKYDAYSKDIPLVLRDTLSGKVNKVTGVRNTKVLTKRNWMEYFLTPESLKGNFEELRKAGKVAADLEWGDFLKSKGLKIQDIQAHHINPLKDSMHLFHGVKWGSDEYWEIVSTLINRGAPAGIAQKGDTVNNIVRTFGKSSLTDTPHGIAHEFYRDVKKVFFSEKEIRRMANPNGFIDETGKFWKPKEYRTYKTKQWAGIVNRSEEILLETHKAWKALNPKTRMDFNELVETMSKYDNKGIIKGIHPKYQVKDIQELVKEVQFQDLQIRFQALDEADWRRNLDKEFVMDIIGNMSKRDLKRKWGKKYNLKQSGMKQLDLFYK